MMDMDGWQDFLHLSFLGEHVLFASLRLSSWFDFLLACVLTVVLCLLEKTLTYALAAHWNPLASRHTRAGNAAFRAALYWTVTLIRLLYMLLAMTFHVGLILVAVTTLSAGQFAIEYLDTPHPYAQQLRFADGEPLLPEDRRAPAPGEYHDVATPSTAGRYPPRKHAGNGATLFALDDGEDTT